jgi:hypothetical protein
MHFLIGLGILGGLVWFAFGAGVARVVVGVVLAVPVLAILIFITGEATRGGPDDVPFGKLGHRVTVDQPPTPQEQAYQARIAEREAIEQANREARRAAYDAIAVHQPLGGFPPIGK